MRFRVTERLFMVAMTTALCGGLYACDDSGGCFNSSDSPDGDCYCARGESCAHQCDEGEQNCSLGCYSQNQTCSIDTPGSCNAACQGAESCEARCGPDSMVSCQGTKLLCDASVGDDSIVQCEVAQRCEVECSGSCVVDCINGGRCRVRCADVDTCDVRCAKIGDTEPILCPDGQTKVCGMEC